MPRIVKVNETNGQATEKVIINEISSSLDPPSDLSVYKSVPPSTPFGSVDVYNLPSLPQPFPQLTKLKIPYIREVGICSTIDILADFFQCPDYRMHPIQFWFLDILTDCLWRSQDEFQFPEEHQKVILAWMLYVFDLIRNPKLNLSRKRLFQIFNEAIRIAEIHIESAESALVSLPEHLFTLHVDVDGAAPPASTANKADGGDKDAAAGDGDGDDDKSSFSAVNSQLSISSSDSSITLPESTRNSVVAVKINDDAMDFFHLPVKSCPWDDECFTSSVETLSEKSLNPNEPQIFIRPSQVKASVEVEVQVNEELLGDAEDNSIPSRFVSEIKEEIPSIKSVDVTIDSLESTNLNLLANDTYQWKIRTPTPPVECPSQIFTLSMDTIGDSLTRSSQYKMKKSKHSKISITKRKSSLKKSSFTKEDSVKSSTKARVSAVESKTANVTKIKTFDKNKNFSKERVSNISLKSGIFEEVSEFAKEDDVLKSWFFHHLWQKRIEDMSDPKKGWVPTSKESLKDNSSLEHQQSTRNYTEVRQQWKKYLEDQKTLMDQLQENMFINSCVLMAIKQFVFDYFYESFNYKIIKTALRQPHRILTEKINDNWFVPKVIIDTLKKPKIPKQPKTKKPKSPKKERKSKSSEKSDMPKKKLNKKTQKSDKSSKKAKKTDKGTKKSKKKSSKPSESKKGKKKKLTAEEKAEIKRQAEEAKRLREEQMKAEENRRFMFPLADAADDDFFKSIFANWENMNERKDSAKRPKVHEVVH